MGALAWLMAHGSGITVQGVAVGVVPLGLTAICAWSMWRVAHRVGDALSGHGPDADRISDGERDLTVPVAALAPVTRKVDVAAESVPVTFTPGTNSYARN